MRHRAHAVQPRLNCFLRIDEDGQPLTGDEAELRTFATEAEAYAFLGLPFIEPELREDRGEIEAALAGQLPELITIGDLRGDLHSHSDWSDGTHPIEVMAEHARRRGHAYQVLTDQPGKDAWPITTGTFILVHKVQDKPANAAAVLKFFEWAYKSGDKTAIDLDYVPNTARAKRISTALSNSMGFGGHNASLIFRAA